MVIAMVCAVALLAPAGAKASARQDRVERKITKMLNYIRAANGLPALHANWRLARAADRRSHAMARTNTLAHSARRPGRRIHGQTLAWMPRGTRDIAGKTVRAWMNSPAHRAALMDGRFRRIGVARARGHSGSFITAELMG